MLSTDSRIFESDSDVRRRMIQYESLFDSLEILVMLVTKEGYKRERINKKLMITPVVTSKLFYLIKGYLVGKKLERPDVISSENPFETGIVGFFLSKYFSAKYQVQVHTDFMNPLYKKESIKNRIRVVIGKHILKKADCIRVVSPRIKGSLINILGIDEEKISILPIYSILKKGKTNIGINKKYPEFDKVVFMASRLTKEKNIHLAIKTLKNILNTHRKVGLIIAGEGPLKNNLILYAKDLGISENVRFLGWIDDIGPYLRECDVFLHTSNYEGFGMVFSEARIEGATIVSTDVGIAHDEGAFIINKETIREGLTEALNGNLKPQGSVAKWTYKNMDDYLACYKSVMERCYE